MPIYSGYVQASGKDWDESGGGSTATTLTFVRTNVGGSPTVNTGAYAIISTSAVTTGGTITAATFYWKHNTNDAAKSMRVGAWNGSNYNTDIYLGVGGGANVWKSQRVTGATELACLNASGGVETAISFAATHTSDVTRTLKVYSFDSGQTSAPYVVIEYNDPVVASAYNSRKRIMIIQ